MDKKSVAREFLKNVNCSNLRAFVSDMEDGTKGLYVILRVIYETEGEVTAGSIANTLGISTARVAVALKNLESKGFIKKYKSPLDGRKTLVELTDTGLDEFKKHIEKVVDMLAELFEKLTDDEAQQMLFIIKKMLNH